MRPLLVGLVAWLAPAAPPSAAGPTITLEYVAPEECPQEAEVRAMIHASLDGLPDDGQRHDVRAVAQVSDDEPERFRLELTIVSGEQRRQRTLSDSSCEALTRAGATLVAIAVDPRLGALNQPLPETNTVPVPPDAPIDPKPRLRAAPRPAAPPPVEAPTAVSTPAISSEPPPSTRRHRRNKPVWALAIGGGASVNVLPGVAGVGSATVEASWPWWGLAAGLRSEPSKRGGTSEANGRFSSVGAVLEGCGTPGMRNVEFPLCVGITVGGMRGRATDTAEKEVGWFPLLNLHGGPGVRWHAHRSVHVWLAAEVVIPVLRGRFVVDMAQAPIHEPGRVGGAARVGVAFPLGGRKSAVR